ncbi:hypothetical protein L6452_26452 [Arctium lappa]|uniref:Uncharacterized protein n=1 Tax=Arctium lappa TaxID=4217 RepID=A0ACB8ZV84_ARCLA|nr:hypothetical protein L6452_26452 [Arctium lappa]
MALTKQTLTLISISALLFSTLYAKEKSSPTPNSSPKKGAVGPAGGSPANSPGGLSHLFDILPSLGVKKEAVAKGANFATKQLQAIEQKIVAFKATIKTRLADTKTTGPAKKCLTQCDENFDDAADDARTGIESINKGDLTKANFDISAVQTDVETCHDCFREAKAEDAEITNFGEWVQGVAGDCLKSLKT